MTALRVALVALLLYALTGVVATVLYVQAGATPRELSVGLIRLAGMLLLAWGLWRQQLWAWWFVVGVAAVAALLGIAGIVIGVGEGVALGAEVQLIVSAILATVVVAALLMPGARAACGVRRKRTQP